MIIPEHTETASHSHLLDHQKRAVKHLVSNQRAGLFHSAGLGKTLSTITSIQSVVATTSILNSSVLIACPNHLTGTWADEIGKWGGSQEWKVVPYSQFTPKNLNTLRGNDIVVFDEVHYLKNLKKVWNQAIRRYTGYSGSTRAKVAKEIASDATFCWGLSATPYPNVPTELLGIYVAMGMENLVYPRSNFMQIMKVPMKEVYTRGMGAQTTLVYDEKHPRISRGELLGWMCNMWDYQDKRNLDLPKKLYQRVTNDLKLPAKLQKLGRELIENMNDFGFESIGEFAQFNRECGVRKSRMPATASWLEGIAENGEQEVIFFRHRDVLHNLEIAATTKNLTYSIITGGQTDDYRKREITDFVSGHSQIIFVNIANAEGMNLQCASRATFFEMPWNPKENIQAQDRVHRMGSDVETDVLITYMVSTDMDRHIWNMLNNKSEFYGKES